MTDLLPRGLCLLLAVTALAFWHRGGELSETLADERAAHAGTRASLALEQTRTALLARDALEADAVIRGLQDQVEACLRLAEQDRAAAASRAAIARSAAAAPVPPRGIVDDATSREVVRHLNRALEP